jgi:putative ABC transport system ATP-binding protein
VQASERVALVGPSGCGKTTLAHLIAGVVSTPEGQVEVLGQRLHELGEDARRRLRIQRIGMVFQRFELLEYLRVKQNIMVPALISAGTLPRPQDTDIRRYAERLGIAHKLDSYPSELSQGERQRVAICRALITEPGLLIADEPTGNLDPTTAATIMDLLEEEVRHHRCTFLMVTHDHSLLGRFDRVVDCARFFAGS